MYWEDYDDYDKGFYVKWNYFGGDDGETKGCRCWSGWECDQSEDLDHEDS